MTYSAKLLIFISKVEFVMSLKFCQKNGCFVFRLIFAFEETKTLSISCRVQQTFLRVSAYTHIIFHVFLKKESTKNRLKCNYMMNIIEHKVAKRGKNFMQNHRILQIKFLISHFDVRFSHIHIGMHTIPNLNSFAFFEQCLQLFLLLPRSTFCYRFKRRILIYTQIALDYWANFSAWHTVNL